MMFFGGWMIIVWVIIKTRSATQSVWHGVIPMLPATQYTLRFFIPPQYLFHAKKCRITQELPLTWHHSLSTL